MSVCVLPFDSSWQDGAVGHLLHMAMSSQKGGTVVPKAGHPAVPVKPVFGGALLWECTSLFHSETNKQENQQGNPGRYFLPAGACGFITINRTLN